MADWIDRAQEDEAAHQAKSLAAHLRRPRPSVITSTCMSCGEEIPPLRRAALPGCCLCCDCQTEFERGMK